MSTLADLPTPALLLDLDVVEANVAAMASRARRLGVALRPHVKTHKCVEVAKLQHDEGACGVTVSTLAEARAFADAGFVDQTWAFPLPLSRIDDAVELLHRIDLGLLVDDVAPVDALVARGVEAKVWIKVDCGYHRAGVDPRSDAALVLARRIDDASKLRLAGVLTHGGHSYACRGADAIAVVAAQERDEVVGFASRLRDEGIAVPEVSLGSTPTMSVADDLTGVTEARPGNYVFYDYSQVRIGSCEVGDCGVTVLSTVSSSPRGSGRAVVDAGALALSKDPGPDPGTLGLLFADYRERRLRDDVRLVSLSQEHGLLDGELTVGDRVRILPNHSCLTVACFDRYHVLRGDEVVDRWEIHRARG